VRIISFVQRSLVADSQNFDYFWGNVSPLPNGLIQVLATLTFAASRILVGSVNSISFFFVGKKEVV